MVAGNLTLSRTGQIPLRTIAVPDLKPRWYDAAVGKIVSAANAIVSSVSCKRLQPFLRAE